MGRRCHCRVGTVGSGAGVIVVALQSHNYKITFEASWDDGYPGGTSGSWGLVNDPKDLSMSCTGACSITKQLEFSENQADQTAILTVINAAPGTLDPAAVECTIRQDGKTVAHERATGTVTCTAPVGKGAPS